MVRELFSSESFRGLNERKPNHKLSLRRRHGLGENLSSTEQVKLRNAKKLLPSICHIVL